MWLTQAGLAVNQQGTQSPSGCSRVGLRGILHQYRMPPRPLSLAVQGAPRPPTRSGPISVLRLPQWSFLFQGVIRDHVSKSRLWSQHARAEIRAIPLTSSVIFGKLLTSLCLNSVISKWGRTGVSTSWDWCKAESSENPVRIFYFSATVVKQMILNNLKWSL